MNLKNLFALMVCLLTYTVCFTQKVVVESGSMDFLKSGQNIEIEYIYDPMGVGKFKTSDEYVTKKKKEYNEKEKGKGDEWEKNWLADRSLRYEPKFEELLKEHCDKLKYNAGGSKDYTMIVHTTFVEPGFNVGVARKNASINLSITFKDKSGKEKAVLSIKNIPGRDWGGYDYETGYRIEEAYAKAGKVLGNYFHKQLK